MELLEIRRLTFRSFSGDGSRTAAKDQPEHDGIGRTNDDLVSVDVIVVVVAARLDDNGDRFDRRQRDRLRGWRHDGVGRRCRFHLQLVVHLRDGVRRCRHGGQRARVPRRLARTATSKCHQLVFGFIGFRRPHRQHYRHAFRRHGRIPGCVINYLGQK